MEGAKVQYSKLKEKYEGQVKELTKSMSLIGSLRLLTFIVGASMTIYTYFMKTYIACGIIFMLSASIFAYLVIAHRRAKEEREHAQTLTDINVKSLKRVMGEWKEFEDDGSEFMDESHRFSGDLDIFGKGSLFQWINTAGTYMGRQIMKKRLTGEYDKEDTVTTQQAVSELSGELNFRQEYNARGLSSLTENPENLFKWGEEIEEFYLQSWLSFFVKILPAVTIIVLIVSLTTNLIGKEWKSIFICIQILLLIPGKAQRSVSLSTIYKYKDNIKVYRGMLQLLSQKDFKSCLLNEYKANVKDTEGMDAAVAIDKLSKICDMVSERRNMYFIIVDILLLWDYQCMIELERWKLKYGKCLSKWLQTAGEFEALMSISLIAFEHEDWAMPEFDDDVVIDAQKLGHPLLGGDRVCNDVSIKKDTNILLITGSNMSGKSTFLRTVGINLILSYMGAPVCAEKFSCSRFNVYTCMRISDNLEKSISSFYAEILRIKMIAEASKKGEKIFFLLDEIFKGTNSSDRHLGAKLLIKQLGEEGASGIVSTHDLELAEMEKEYGRIKNYHFQEYYKDNELKFDYKLRPGVSTTRNALYLIKLAGINTDADI